MSTKSILVFGAGSIGSYIGGSFAAQNTGGPSPFNVTFLGRPYRQKDLKKYGLRLTSWDGSDTKIPPESISFVSEWPADLKPDYVFLAVKSQATQAAFESFKARLPEHCVIVSFQNGLFNGRYLRENWPAEQVIRAVVPYNVIYHGEGHYHNATEGILYAEDTAAGRDLRLDCTVAGVPIKLRKGIIDLAWGKLVLNLNNPVNALAGIPLKEQLSSRDYRRVIAGLIDEALGICKAAGIKPGRTGKILPAFAPLVLRLPNFLFTRIAAQMMKIDPHARSSMADDIMAGRLTEVDYLNGEVVKLAESLGLEAPFNAAITKLIHQVENENKGGGGVRYTAAELAAVLKA